MTTDSEGLHPIANNEAIAQTDIVFIHGLGGESHSTWRYGKEGKPDSFFWPEELGKELPLCAIWTVGYPAGITALGEPGMSIEKRAGNLSQKLANKGLGNRPLLFITHSMGGLVVKSMIVTSQTQADQDRKRLASMVRGIVFCATPHRGSDFANAAGVLSKFFGGSQVHVDEMKANAIELDLLHEKFIDWHHRNRIPVKSYAESVKLFNNNKLGRLIPLGLVVPRASANPGIAGHTVLDVDDDHLTLVKPRNKKHDVYAGVLRWINEEAMATPTSAPETILDDKPPKAGKLLTNLPNDSLGSLFKGRDEVIEQIRANLLEGSKKATAILAKQTIHGLGGIGKTRLAVEYAWQCMNEYTACLFVVAETPQQLQSSLAELCRAQILDLPEKEAQEEERQFDATLRWLNQHPGWLLILDNVDTVEAGTAVERLLPTLQNGHVLITSRRTNWSNSVCTLELDSLDEEAAVAFLLEKTHDRRTASEGEEEAARRLAVVMGGLALALEQAGSFINAKRISIKDYLQRWEKQEAKLREWHDGQVMAYPKSLSVTWDTSFEQLTQSAQALLNMLTWFAPEPVPRDIFEAAFNAETLVSLMTGTDLDDADTTEYPDLEDMFDELASLSLMKWHAGNRSFSIHRLVQEITQSRLSEGYREQSLQAAVELIDDACPVDPPPDDVRAWKTWDPLRSHMEQLIHAVDAAGITDPTSQLMNKFGRYLSSKNLLGEAEPLMRRALEIDETSFGRDHPIVASNLNNLAQLLKTTNRLEEAEPLMRRAMEIDEVSFGSDHPNVARDLNNLAQLLQVTHRLVEAEPLMRRALAIDEASFGSDHPNVARDLNNLAQLLQVTHRLVEAEPLMRRALEIDEASFGSDHPNVSRDLNNLAQLLQATDRLEEAEPLMRRALEIDEASFGSDHPRVAIRLNNLAQLFQATHRLEEAEPLCRRMVEIFMLFTMCTGHKHPNLNTAIENYEDMLEEMGYDEQEQQSMIKSLVESVKSRGSS